MKIVITDANAVNPGDLSWDFLNKYGQVVAYPRTPEELARERLSGADIILINKTPITAELLDACPTIKLICVLATGYNVVDCDAAAARGIPVCNVPDYSTNSVAQFTFNFPICKHLLDYEKSASPSHRHMPKAILRLAPLRKSELDIQHTDIMPPV